MASDFRSGLFTMVIMNSDNCAVTGVMLLLLWIVVLKRMTRIQHTKYLTSFLSRHLCITSFFLSLSRKYSWYQASWSRISCSERVGSRPPASSLMKVNLPFTSSKHRNMIKLASKPFSYKKIHSSKHNQLFLLCWRFGLYQRPSSHVLWQCFIAVFYRRRPHICDKPILS